MDLYGGEMYHFDIQQIKEKRDQKMTAVLQKLKIATNRMPPPHTQDPSPPERKEHSRLIEHSVDRSYDGAVLMSKKLAKCKNTQLDLSHLLRDLRKELKKASPQRRADLRDRRRVLRSELAKSAKLYAHLIAGMRRGGRDLPSDTARTVARPSAIPSKAIQTAIPGPAEVLPIDQYREEILRRVGGSRISIIGGETGCGKSSRLPVMLLEDAESKGRPCCIMVRI
jgi:hypothetical protein